MPETQTPVSRPKTLLADLQKLVRRLTDDLRTRTEDDPQLRTEWEQRHQAAMEAGGTAENYTDWRGSQLTQIAVAWVLATVFVRYLEDNHFLGERFLAGEGDDRRRVRDQMSAYFHQHPQHTDREYLQHVFRTVANLPGCAELLGEQRNPLWRLGLSGDAAKQLLDFWQDQGAEGLLRPMSGEDTRFLGDLYQDLSEEARSRYALLQTPDFVEEFILDYTLNPAIEEFGLENTTLIDPTCGSGHFLLGAFSRLLDRWQRAEPGTNIRELAKRALEAVHGVDINPFAVAIARFRLLLAYLQACGIHRLAECPDVHPRVATGDSLLHGRTVDAKGGAFLLEWPPDVVATGDHEDALRILKARYSAVVGNPPYIVDRDKAHNAAVREHYYSAYRQFSLGVPFTERFFDLAHRGGRAGFVGMITTNSFMKREFGKKLIQEILPKLDITHILDACGAYIPGHGTPTVILFGRSRPPARDSVRAVLGIRGEPALPSDPSQGKVWSALLKLVQLDEETVARKAVQSDFLSVADPSRQSFQKHPWSMGGGGATELKQSIENSAKFFLGKQTVSIGRGGHTGSDDAYLASKQVLLRRRVPGEYTTVLVEGEVLRDWGLHSPTCAVFPYDEQLRVLPDAPSHPVLIHLWSFRELLWNRREPQGTHREIGFTWHQYSRFHPERYSGPGIAFAFVSTHNHFVLDRGGKLFKQSAPVIKLPPSTSEEQHQALLGLLNSSLACFWFKQVCHNKGMRGQGGGITEEGWEQFIEVTAAAIEAFPVANVTDLRLIALAKELDEAGEERAQLLAQLEKQVPSGSMLDRMKAREEELFRRSTSLQEELDWLVYELYKLIPKAPLASGPPPIDPAQRPFAIRMAQEVAEGNLETTWFERHNATHQTEIPADWPADYAAIVKERLRLIAEEPSITWMEKPEFKRRWLREPWDKRIHHALKSWLLDRLEMPGYWPEVRLTSSARLADRAAKDEEFLQVARLYVGRDDVNVASLVGELVNAESVPALPFFRYKPSGLAKRYEWENTWELQRREDRGEKVGTIPVPPRYVTADFQKHYWLLRGKLDVPKERFVSHLRLERDIDPSLVISWAGWDTLEQAQAVAGYYLERKEQDGWPAEKLLPALATLAELLPWLLQWHNEVHPEFGERMGDYYKAFIEQEARELGATLDGLVRWAHKGQC